MDALIQAIHELSKPGLLDILNFIATLLLSGAAVAASLIIANKENKTALLDQRYEAFLHVNNILSLGKELGRFSDETSPPKKVEESQGEPVPPSSPLPQANPRYTSSAPLLLVQYRLLSMYLLDISPEPRQKSASESAPPAPMSFSKDQKGRMSSIINTCKEWVHWISSPDIVYAQSTQISAESVRLEWNRFQHHPYKTLFKKMDSGKFDALVNACDQYLHALIKAHRVYYQTVLLRPESKMKYYVNRKDFRDNQWVYQSYFSYVTAHPEIDYDAATAICKEDIKMLATHAEALEASLLAFAKECQDFEKTQLPILEKYISL